MNVLYERKKIPGYRRREKNLLFFIFDQKNLESVGQEVPLELSSPLLSVAHPSQKAKIIGRPNDNINNDDSNNNIDNDDNVDNDNNDDNDATTATKKIPLVKSEKILEFFSFFFSILVIMQRMDN